MNRSNSDRMSESAIPHMVAKSFRRMENMRKGFLANRDISLRIVRERREEISRKVAEVQKSIEQRRELINIQGATVNLRGTITQRVDRGLIELSTLVQDLRDALIGRELSEEMNLDPVLHGEIEAEASKIIRSEFFKALISQLRKEKERSA